MSVFMIMLISKTSNLFQIMWILFLIVNYFLTLTESQICLFTKSWFIWLASLSNIT